MAAVVQAGRPHEVAQPAPVAALQARGEQRAERHLLAVLCRARVQRVERVADQVLGARAGARRAGDLHRQAAQHEPAQQPVQELGRRRAAVELDRAPRYGRGRTRSATAARRSRRPPRRPRPPPAASRAARTGSRAGRRGPRACAPPAPRPPRPGRRRPRSAAGRDRCAGCPAASRITLTGEAMPSAVSCVGTTISGSSASAQADFATSMVLPPPTATTASAVAQRRRRGDARDLGLRVRLHTQRLAGRARAARRTGPRASGAVNVVPLTTATASKSSAAASSSSARDQLRLPRDRAQVARQLHVAAPDREPVAARRGLRRRVGPHATRASTSSRACARSSWSSISIQARPSTGDEADGQRPPPAPGSRPRSRRRAARPARIAPAPSASAGRAPDRSAPGRCTRDAGPPRRPC